MLPVDRNTRWPADREVGRAPCPVIPFEKQFVPPSSGNYLLEDVRDDHLVLTAHHFSVDRDMNQVAIERLWDAIDVEHSWGGCNIQVRQPSGRFRVSRVGKLHEFVD